MAQAALYRRVVWQTSTLPAGAELRLVWATRDDPKKLHERPLHRSTPTGGVIDLTGELRWQGRIALIGLGIRGPLDQPLTVRRLELWPTTLNAGVLLRELVADWTTFDNWSQRSINFLEGAPANALFPPAVTAALWFLFSAVLYGLFNPPRRGADGLLPYGGFLVLAWLAVDLRWQADLHHRLEATAASFADKRGEERGMALDGDYGQFLAQVRRHLPERPVRLFIINTETPSYRGGRARYLLLPHNGYAGLARLPARGKIGNGDYVLVLTPPAGLRYDAEQGVLQQAGVRLPVEPLHTEAFGTLYRVREGA